MRQLPHTGSGIPGNLVRVGLLGSSITYTSCRIVSTSRAESQTMAAALQGAEEAGALIDAYDPAVAGPDHELFHQVARIERVMRPYLEMLQ